MRIDEIEIRLLTADDLLPYFDLVERNKARLADFFAGTVTRTQTLEDTRLFLAEIEERKRANSYLPYVIVEIYSGKFIGFLDLKNIDWNIPKCEIGCYIDEIVAGNGIASKAFCSFCDMCFNELGFEKLFLRTHESNTAAIRLAEKTGFQKEGLIRSDYKTTAGRLVDLLYYGRLKNS